MSDNKISLIINADDLLELARKSYDNKDKNQAIIYLKEALELDKSNNDARHFLAQIYQEMDLYILSNEVLYEGLHLHKGENVDEYYSQLSFNFLQLKVGGPAIYYLKKMDLPFLQQAIESSEEQEEVIENMDYTNPLKGFSLVNPKTDNIYDDVLKEAFELVQSQHPAEALDVLKTIPEGVRQEAQVVHLTMICYLLLGNHDKVINIALKYLRKNDNLQIKCMLASTLSMEKRVDEAYDVVSDILLRDYKELPDMLTVLPVLINMNVHAQVVKYIKRIVKILPFQPSMYLWLGQGLYNMGKKLEAKKTFNMLDKICGEGTPAKYYLEIMKNNPDIIEYNEGIPSEIKFSMFSKIKVLLSHNGNALRKDLKGDDIGEVVKFIFTEGNDQLVNDFMMHVVDYHSLLEKYYREILIKPLLSHNNLQAILFSFVAYYSHFNIDIVTNGIFKEIDLILPKAYWNLPKTLHTALFYAIVDIIYNDPNPSEELLPKLVKLIDSLYSVDDNDDLIRLSSCCDQLSRFRDVKALTFVLYGWAYALDDEELNKMCLENDIKPSLFMKYYNTIFKEEVNNHD